MKLNVEREELSYWFKKAVIQFAALMLLSPFLVSAFPFAVGAILLLIKVYIVGILVVGTYLAFTSNIFRRHSTVNKEGFKKLYKVVSWSTVAAVIGLSLGAIAAYRTSPAIFGVLLVSASTVIAVKTCATIGAIIGGLLGWVKGQRNASDSDGLV